MLFPTSLVGSYPQPDWLIDRERLGHRFPPGSGPELWRVIPSTWSRPTRTRRCWPSGREDAPDIITDGDPPELLNRFATALTGDDNPGTALTAAGTRTRAADHRPDPLGGTRSRWMTWRSGGRTPAGP